MNVCVRVGVITAIITKTGNSQNKMRPISIKTDPVMDTVMRLEKSITSTLMCVSLQKEMKREREQKM